MKQNIVSAGNENEFIIPSIWLNSIIRLLIMLLSEQLHEKELSLLILKGFLLLLLSIHKTTNISIELG